MNTAKIACMAAALLIGASLTATTVAFAGSPRTVVVEGKRFDPSLQRRISYADLNLAKKTDQKILKSRIYLTAGDLCWDLNGYGGSECQSKAVHGTDKQFAAAVERAERQMAGLPVGPLIAVSMVIGTR